MHEPHTKKESLFLFLPPRSVHPKEAWKDITHGLLNKYWRSCFRVEDYITKIRQLYRVLENRAHCPMELSTLFKEVSRKSEEQHK